jgi:hypothetical protein
MTPAELLRREGTGLVDRLRLWTPARWSAAAPALGTRGDVVHHLAQRLADDAAGLEGGPRRPLPRLDTDLVLADQLAVTLDDLLRAAPPAELCRRTTAHLLLHRTQLLGDEVPAGLPVALELDDVLRTGRQECGAEPS